MRQSIRVGTFAGVDVGVNWSVLVIFGLLTWELATIVFPHTYGGARASYWVAGFVAAVVFFASLLAHEVSHAVVARRNGVGVQSITLWLFGGVAQLEGEAHTAGADFRIAAVGPGTSIALAVLFAGGQLAATAAGAGGLPADVFSWLWKINLLLAAFNLIPAAPLDGGRILRAALWRLWGDRSRASVAAARAGRAFGLLLVLGGIVEFAYGGLYGLWPAVLGWFLYSAAGVEERAAKIRSGMAQLTVGQVMVAAPPTVPGHATVAEVGGLLWSYQGAAVPVTDDQGFLAGVLTVDAVRSVPTWRAAHTSARDLAVPLSAVPVGRAEEPALALLGRMAAAGGTPALVLDGANRLAGIVSAGDLERAVAVGGHRSPQPAGR